MARKILFFILIAYTIWNCSKLDEKFQGDLTADQIGNDSNTNTAALLEGVYNSMGWPFTSGFQTYALSGITTDEAIVPTRGANWDDNGMWRTLHQHRWNADHILVKETFNGLGGMVYAATDLLRFNPTPQQQAEARFLRAFAMYWLLDLYDQAPYREPGDNVVQSAEVRKGIEALNYIISEINAIAADLPDVPAGRANKDAAKVLLMKCYLNKGVYANRANPAFSAEDMNTVIALADEIINSGKYSFSPQYFDNFAPDNTNIGTENIFTRLNNTPNNLLFFTWLAVLHYSQGGVNGWATTDSFYQNFEPADKRRGIAYDYPGGPPNPGRRVNVGFLVGQQYDWETDEPLQDGTSAPLIFTPDVKSIETGLNLELTGIRPLKYARDNVNPWSPDNDFVFFRFPDVLLMKAEAILRGGTPTTAGSYGNTALSIVNAIRTDSSRNATHLNHLDLNNLLDERGRELWWEGYRRNDLIRFGKFLQPFQEKDYESAAKYLLFPIPNEQLAVNPNLEQNPGY